MDAKPVLLINGPPAAAIDCQCPSDIGRHFSLSDYWALTKPEVNFLIVIATFVGFYLGSPGPLDQFTLLQMVRTFFGTLLVASGSGALNQFIERDFDAQMRRTRRRPLTAGRMEPSRALWFGVVLSIAGVVSLDDGREPPRRRAGRLHTAELSFCLHSAQTKNGNVRARRCCTGSNAPADWICGGDWQAEHRSLGAFSPPVSLAISPFHGNRLDVPRRL